MTVPLFPSTTIMPTAPSGTPRPHSRGFTILELMVTAAIIVVLLSLFLPAIHVARQAARRTQCQNNLKQIGLALTNYHETFECFPPGYVARNVTPEQDFGEETGPGYAWALLLLDFVDQAPLAITIAYDLDAMDPINASAMSTVMPHWLCPSGRAPGAFDVSAGPGIYMLSSSNYVGMYGFGDLTASPGRPVGGGAFYRNSHTCTWTIGDGLSNTLLVAERSAWHDFEPGAVGLPANSTWFAALPGASRPAGATQASLMVVGPASLVLGTVGLDAPGLENLRPNHTNFIGSFSSDHPGGLNAALADSSVRFVSDQVDAQVLRSLAQTNDGGVTGEY